MSRKYERKKCLKILTCFIGPHGPIMNRQIHFDQVTKKKKIKLMLQDNSYLHMK